MNGSLDKRGKESWRYTFYIEGQPRRGTIRAKSKRAAQEQLRTIINDAETGSFIEPSKITVSEYLAKWLKAKKLKVGSTTFQRYSEHCDRHIIPAMGGTRLQKMQPIQIEDFLSDCLESGRLDGTGGLSAQTVLHIYRMLKLSLTQAVGWRILKTNPMDSIAAPVPIKDEILFLDKAETAMMLLAAEGKEIYTPILVAVTTGLRRGELLALRWSDVDFEKNHLDVKQALIDTKERGLEFKAPKSKAGKRRISLPAITVQELKRHRNRQAEQFLKLGHRPCNDDLVFLTHRRDGTLGARTPRALTKVFDNFIKQIDVTQITLHGLRHTHITHLLMDKEPINLVSKRAGHSTVSITLDVYGHVLKENQEELAINYGDALNQALAEAGKNV